MTGIGIGVCFVATGGLLSESNQTICSDLLLSSLLEKTDKMIDKWV